MDRQIMSFQYYYKTKQFNIFLPQIYGQAHLII